MNSVAGAEWEGRLRSGQVRSIATAKRPGPGPVSLFLVSAESPGLPLWARGRDIWSTCNDRTGTLIALQAHIVSR
jgi:hypothetical protein